MSNFDNIKLAFDIGAYDGGYTAGLLSAGVEKVVCIEPNPYSFSRLSDRMIGTLNVIPINKAVSSKSGEKVTFFVSKKHPPISTASRQWVTDSRFTDNKDENEVSYEWDEEIEVDTVNIDELIDCFGAPQFIKVDVEGYNYEVLTGLNMFLKDTVITFEFPEECVDSTVKSLDHLHNLGYNNFGLVEGDRIDRFPEKYHSHDTFTRKICQAFPSSTKEFYGMVFVKK